MLDDHGNEFIERARRFLPYQVTAPKSFAPGRMVEHFGHDCMTFNADVPHEPARWSFYGSTFLFKTEKDAVEFKLRFG